MQASRMSQIQMSTQNLYDRVLQSYDQRRPKPIVPDPTITDRERQDIDYLSRLLNEIGDRLLEITSIVEECPADILASTKPQRAQPPPQQAAAAPQPRNDERPAPPAAKPDDAD